MERHAVPELNRAALRHLMERVAAFSGQSVNEEHPLLSAALPDGERFQGVLPATTNGGAFAIRKQVVKDMRLQEYRKRGSFEAIDIGDPNAERDRYPALRASRRPARSRTSSALPWPSAIRSCSRAEPHPGKTTFLNAILHEVPAAERIITIEDTREVKPVQPNYLPLVASKGDQGSGACYN